MSYSITCGDVMPGCTAHFEADSQPELLEQVVAHAAADHGITEITPEVEAAVAGAIVAS